MSEGIHIKDGYSYQFRDILLDNVTIVNMNQYGLWIQQFSASSGNLTILNSTTTGCGIMDSPSIPQDPSASRTIS